MKIYSPNQAKVLFEYWTPEIEYFIIGGVSYANEAQTISEEFPKVKCIGFEPCPETFYTQSEEREFPGKLYPYALWNQNSTKDMHILGENGRSSRLCGPLPTRTKKPIPTIPVETRTLDSLSAELGPWSNVSLWLDIEHSEEAALQGATDLLERTLLVNVEVNDWKRNLPKFSGLLKPHNIYLAKTWNANMVPGRVDAIFLRE